MSRPTPETDAAKHDMTDYGPPVPCSWGDWVHADFAERLERERDEAREHSENEIGKLIVRLNKSIFRRKEAERERDEWRKKFELSVDAVEIAARLARAESERDEAKTELEMWRDGNIMHQIHKDECEKAERERNEAREKIENLKLQLGLWEDGNIICEETLGEIRLLKEQINRVLLECNEAHKIAERTIDALAWFNETNAQRLRAELEQIKEEAK
jgi:hypothetical protein